MPGYTEEEEADSSQVADYTAVAVPMVAVDSAAVDSRMEEAVVLPIATYYHSCCRTGYRTPLAPHTWDRNSFAAYSVPSFSKVYNDTTRIYVYYNTKL